MSAAACSAFKRFWGGKEGVFKKKSLFKLHLRQLAAMPTSKGGSKLQQLYDVAKDTFKDTVSPTEEQVQRIREAMSKLFGLNIPLPIFPSFQKKSKLNSSSVQFILIASIDLQCPGGVSLEELGLVQAAQVHFTFKIFL